MSDDLRVVLFFLGIFLCIAAGVVTVEKASCNAKTEEIGFAARWSVMAGCRIEVEPGQWIPLDSYYFKQE